ncbi:MAG: hypothetical protein QHH24_01330 [Candidatus Bathyarchaeota archaeon]|jgi:hypothetical protein|nr:hypothetical protein [Candidatus Bathyarchaeota archaeon]
MKKENKSKERFCGNCDSHSAYYYPRQVFCMRRFTANKEPVVDTLWHCEDWNLGAQECCCVSEAKKQAETGENPS